MISKTGRQIMLFVVLIALLIVPHPALGASTTLEFFTDPPIFTDVIGAEWLKQDLTVAVRPIGGPATAVEVEVKVHSLATDLLNDWLDYAEDYSSAMGTIELLLDPFDPLFSGDDPISVPGDIQQDEQLFAFGRSYLDLKGYGKDRVLVFRFEDDQGKPLTIEEGDTAYIRIPLTQLSPSDLGCFDDCAFIPTEVDVTVKASNASTPPTRTIAVTAGSGIPYAEYVRPASGTVVGTRPLLSWQIANSYNLDALAVKVVRSGPYNPSVGSRDWFRDEDGDLDVFVQQWTPPAPLSPGRYMWWIATAVGTDLFGNPTRVLYTGPFYFTVSADCDPAASQQTCVQPEQFSGRPLEQGTPISGLLSDLRLTDTFLLNAAVNTVVEVDHGLSGRDNLRYEVELRDAAGNRVPLLDGSATRDMAAFYVSTPGPYTLTVKRSSGRGYYELMWWSSYALSPDETRVDSTGGDFGYQHLYMVMPGYPNGTSIVHAAATKSSQSIGMEILDISGRQISGGSVSAPGGTGGAGPFRTPSTGPAIVHLWYKSGPNAEVRVRWENHMPTIEDIQPGGGAYRGWVARNMATDQFAFIPAAGSDYTVEFKLVNPDGSASSLKSAEVKLVDLNTGRTLKTHTANRSSSSFTFTASDADPLELQVRSTNGYGYYALTLAGKAPPAPVPPAPGPSSGGSPSTCVKPTVLLWEAELAPAGAPYKWQLVYKVSGATHVRVFDNTVQDPGGGIFPIYQAVPEDNYLGWWTLNAYNGSEECYTIDSRELRFNQLPPNGTYSNKGGFTDVDVSQRSITISLRDNAAVDGDRVDVFLNGVKVVSNYSLAGSFKAFPVTLKAGRNEIRVVALNEGSSSPNTVQIRISHVISGIPDQVSRGLLTGQADVMVIRAP